MNVAIKFSFLPLFIILFSFASKANQIDSLKTDQDVMEFLQKTLHVDFIDEMEVLSDKIFTKTPYYSSQDTSYHMDKRLSGLSKGKFWFKEDLNYDNNTDLVVTLTNKKFFTATVILILTNGEHNYSVKRLNKTFLVDKVAMVSKIAQVPCILLSSIDYSKCKSYNDNSCAFKTDTLSYRLNEFIEYKTNTQNHHIEKITVSKIGGGMEKYGAVYININMIKNNFSCSGDIHRFGDKDSVISKKGIADMETLNKISRLLNYIDFPSIKDTIGIFATHMFDRTIKIEYDGNLKKEIFDIGELGNYGLIYFYEIIDNIEVYAKK